MFVTFLKFAPPVYGPVFLGYFQYSSIEFYFRCDCGECQIMESALECVCCREFDIMDEKRADHMCITLHEGLVHCQLLNRDVIEVSLYEFVAYEGPLDDNVPIQEGKFYQLVL